MDILLKTQKVIETLRGPNGCPWDKKQTFKTLSPHIIEEAYELCQALEESSTDNLKEESGDFLLQVLLIIQLANEENLFTLEEVLQTLHDKLIRRHPHVFGEEKAYTEEEAWKHWESTKNNEKKESVLNSVPKHLPALMFSEKIQKKAARLGFDWPEISDPINKIYTEVDELKEAIISQNKENMEEEFGDILFSLVNVARKLNIKPEEALKKSANKFKKRFQFIEQESEKRNEKLNTLNLQQLDKYWEAAKIET